MNNLRAKMISFSKSIKMRAYGTVDVYCYYDDVDSEQLVVGIDSKGKIVADRTYSSDEDLCLDLGEENPYDDCEQANTFLEKYL